jgi:hypothetical protein
MIADRRSSDGRWKARASRQSADDGGTTSNLETPKKDNKSGLIY